MYLRHCRAMSRHDHIVQSISELNSHCSVARETENKESSPPCHWRPYMSCCAGEPFVDTSPSVPAAFRSGVFGAAPVPEDEFASRWSSTFNAIALGK